MSDTPRTDGEELPHALDDHHFVVGSFFARQLERELNAAHDRMQRLEEALTSIGEYCNRQTKERAMEDACWNKWVKP